MFTRKLYARSQQLTSHPKRAFQQFGKTYQTGFDRMVLDKLSFFRFGGYWFALFGVGNAVAYGASLLMNKDWYRYHFAYTAETSSLFRVFKSMMGSENFSNVVWTAPALIGLNWYMHGKVGPLVMTKFFFMSLFSSYIFLSAFNPQSELNFRPIQGVLPKWDSYADDGSFTMGADQMAQAICYFTLLYHRYWLIALPLMAFDVLYSGPSTLGGPAAAIAGAFMFF
jgi:hypothetical protein